MTPPLVTLIAVAAAGAAFAGCLGDDTLGAPEEEVIEIAPEAVVTQQTGSIKGQVITLDLEPVVREVVELIRGGNATPFVTTTTDLQGRFTFNGVPPEGYRIHIAPECCLEVLEDVVVHAGAVSEVAYMLERIVVYVPYVEENEWTGYVACSVNTIGACSSDPNDHRSTTFDVAFGLQSLVVGMVWKPAGGISSDSLRLVTERAEGPGSGTDYASASGRSPLRLHINDTTIRNDEYQFVNITEEGFRIRHLVTSPSFSITYQQPFTIYWREYYHQLAPEDADAIPPGLGG